MDVNIEYTLFTIKIINLVLHSVGFLSLLSVYRVNEKTIMQLYLCNISLIEAVRNFVNMLLFVPVLPSGSAVIVIHDVHTYIRLLGDVIKILHFKSMIILTLNRLLVTKLDWKYNINCTMRKAQFTLLGNWLVATLIFITFLLYHILSESKEGPSFSFVYLAIDVIYIIIVCITYGVWLHKYKTSAITRAEFAESRIDNTPFEVFQRSRFFILDLLIVSFIVITVIPDLTLHIITLTSDSDSYMYPMVVMVCIPICDLFHAFILYFLQIDIREIFLKTFMCQCCSRNNLPRQQGNLSTPPGTSTGPSHEDAIEMYKL